MTKKLLGLLAGALFSISTVYAVPLACTETGVGNGNPATFNGANGTGGTDSTFSNVAFTCVAPTVPIGDTLTNVTVTIADSFSNGISVPAQTNTVDFLYTFSTFSGVNSLTTSSSSNPTSGENGAATDLGAVVAESPSNGQCTSPDSGHVTCSELTPTAVSFTITGASTWITGGLVNGGSDGFAVTASYTYTPTVTVPEPASLMMIGGGLVGLALAARRRKKA
jgi:hypothetical protein